MYSDRLEQLVATWKQDGAFNQEPINWEQAKTNWLRDLPHLGDFIDQLPTLLDRSSIREIFESDVHATEAKFATVMIWGAGSYGKMSNTQLKCHADVILLRYLSKLKLVPLRARADREPERLDSAQPRRLFGRTLTEGQEP